jgi:hypothetical protein
MRRPPRARKLSEAGDDVPALENVERHFAILGNDDEPAPSSPSTRLSDQLVEEAQTLFQRRTGRTFSLEDARQILENLTGFFCALQRWTRTSAVSGADVQPPNP